ncbi:hypothetical protein C8J57DRAFT_1278992 [Mycena rebaudengoi]|nr:hypothetical protein C8J57DRAFT_1278992 [Mycena rebaudengoi]
MALNLNYAANTYLAVTLPASSLYLQAPASLGLVHPAVAHVGQVGELSDVQLLSIPKQEWDVDAVREQILSSFKDIGRVDVQVPKQRAKRGDDEL